MIELWSGEPASAVGWFAIAEKRADAADQGEPNFRWWRADYVEALLELDRTADAAAVLDEWEDAARRVDRAWVMAQARRCQGLLAAALGDIEGASRHWRRRSASTNRSAIHSAGLVLCSRSA